MSYDLRIWCRSLGDLAPCLSRLDGWAQRGGGWALGARSWQILAAEPQRVEVEDVPAAAADALPGLGALVELSLEPIGAPKTAFSALRAAARAIAEQFSGLIEDPQEGSFTLPRGGKRYEAPKREERFAVLELSWWYANSPLRSPEGPEAFIGLLQRYAAEAVPRRYGLWEPPQYKTEEQGPSALATFLGENLDNSAVFYPSRPFVSFSLADCNAQPHPRLGFRANCFSLQIEESALSQPGWERAVRALWRHMSLFLKPFFGEVRFLSNFTWMGATTGSDMKTDVHPVRSWFWRGLPRDLGVACVVGPPYSSLWKPEGSTREGDLLFTEQATWSERRTLPLIPPSEIAQRWTPAWVRHESGGHTVNWCDQYPEEWPF